MSPSTGIDQPREGIRVVVVDDHELVRRGIRDMLRAADGIDVVGEAASATEAARRIVAMKPDVVLLDVKLPDGSGIEVCRWVRSRQPEVRVLMVTTYDDSDARTAATLAGASGFVLKQIRGAQLVQAVRRVAAGESMPEPTRLPGVGDARDEPPDPRLQTLTVQERRVLDLIVQGLTNGQIGERLGIGEKTVRNHVTNLLRKLGLTGRTQAAVYAVRNRN